MQEIEVDVVSAPARWAGALINGDCSGLDPEDAAAAREFERRLWWETGGSIVSAGDETYYDYWEGRIEEMLDYVIYIV